MKGDMVLLGKYPQGAKGEILPLEWRVLDECDGMALLITDKVIDCMPYHEEAANITWENCTLRAWLHTEFLHEAFSEDERGRIAAVTNPNPSNVRYGTEGGNATSDRIFLLSIDEVKQYFSSDSAMCAVAVPAVKSGSYTVRIDKNSGGCSPWWLRSPGYRPPDALARNASYVCGVGGVKDYGFLVDYFKVGIRPACWVRV